MVVRTFALSLFLGCCASAQDQPEINYDESKVPSYTLPDPLMLRSGERVRDDKTWYQRRRPEILSLFSEFVYGRTPRWTGRPAGELLAIDAHALRGKAIRKELRIYPAGKGGPGMDLVLYLPVGAREPAPIFLGLNFGGNHTISTDPGILLHDVWVRDPTTKAMTRQPARPESRGRAAEQWQVERILARGYGLGTIYYCDIEPDFDGGRKYGFGQLFSHPGPAEPNEWGAIGIWAWGLSRAMDYLAESVKGVDRHRVMLVGHSRLGKTALWAAAQDTRFAGAISNDSGEGGAALSRRQFGERTADLNRAFPHWFCPNFRKFNGHEEDLPVDQHMLLALIAPRPVYVASADEDLWADPKGEFLSAVAAGPIYRLLGKQDLGTDRVPPLHEPIMHDIGYHIRAGAHDVTAYDWEQYLRFADLHLWAGQSPASGR